ncbi:MAG: PC4/YdbC family ssDNA-binding protein, partial [Clostridia bacterium]
GVLALTPTGMSKELSLVSWNGRDPKYDIRDWDEDHEKMSKGVTFTKAEIIKLKEILNSVDLEADEENNEK